MHLRACLIFAVVLSLNPLCRTSSAAMPDATAAVTGTPLEASTRPATDGSVDPATGERDGEAELELSKQLSRPAADAGENPRPGLTVASLGGLQLGLQYTVLYFAEPPNWKAYGNSLEPSFTKLRSNFHVAPVWEPVAFGGGGTLGYLQADGDAWQTNVIGHGLQGSEIYLRMRREGFAWWQAFLGGIVHSTFWEYGMEGWNETPSAWDLGYTPVGGMVFGEVRYQLVSWLEGLPSSWWTESLGVAVDPVASLVAAFRD